MKRLLIIVLLSLFLLVGCKQPLTEDTTQEDNTITTDNTNSSNATASSIEETIEPVKITPEFGDIDYSLTGSKVSLVGFLFDAETDQPMEGALVDIFCNDEAQYNTTTDNNGRFYLSFDLSIQGKCKPGDEAWAQVVFGGRKYRSEAIIIPNLRFLGGSGGGGGGGSGSGSSSGSSSSSNDGSNSNGNSSNDTSSTNSTLQNQVETCTDGIQNQDETGIDCGGVCDPCSNPNPENPEPEETCIDGIQNQDEEGIDCGGICPNECPTLQEEPTHTPEFSTITATLALLCAGAYCLRKRK